MGTPDAQQVAFAFELLLGGADVPLRELSAQQAIRLVKKILAISHPQLKNLKFPPLRDVFPVRSVFPMSKDAKEVTIRPEGLAVDWPGKISWKTQVQEMIPRYKHGFTVLLTRTGRFIVLTEKFSSKDELDLETLRSTVTWTATRIEVSSLTLTQLEKLFTGDSAFQVTFLDDLLTTLHRAVRDARQRREEMIKEFDEVLRRLTDFGRYTTTSDH